MITNTRQPTGNPPYSIPSYSAPSRGRFIGEVRTVTRGGVVAAQLDDSPVIVQLLEAAVGERGRRLDAVAQRYRDDPTWRLLIALAGDEPVGVAGYTVAESEATLVHIATAKSVRRRGIGTELLAAVSRELPADLPLVAETDHSALHFYVATGFSAAPVGEKYPGVERFIVRRGSRP